uniref:Uncharacterized protein n=1 Tax=Ralstonia solanacearum TaxID=305 RepID=A0A0S4U6X1_RALSL|nr:protein of unknown function [Ralstonia solanacearum]
MRMSNTRHVFAFDGLAASKEVFFNCAVMAMEDYFRTHPNRDRCHRLSKIYIIVDTP